MTTAATAAPAPQRRRIVLEKAASTDGKTKGLKAQLAALGLTNALFIDGSELDTGFVQAMRNIPNVDLLPIQGINVYDILRRQKLVLTKAAVAALEERFK